MTPGGAGDGPDYTREGTVFAYRWMPHREAADPASAEVQAVQAELAAALAFQAEREGAELTGEPDLDFPDPATLPPAVRRGLLRTLRRQERRPWRWPGMVLVRAWQYSRPHTPDRPAEESR
ncbi:hypothetical protein [Streptomyces sp. NPDC047525]|uniref:hypothetical protein n=1 Tax=Streptomyces sp. NPDC047525 TaxID=3155264 RepID=UPI003405E7DC